eukprot:s4280_g5.t1
MSAGSPGQVAESLATDAPTVEEEAAGAAEQEVPPTAVPAAETRSSWADASASEPTFTPPPSIADAAALEEVDNLGTEVKSEGEGVDTTQQVLDILGVQQEAKEEVDFTPAEPSGAELASEVETTDHLGLGEDPSVGAEASETVASVPEPDVAENLATDPADDLAAPPTSPNLVPPGVEPLQTGHTPASGSRPPRVRSSRGGQTTRWQEAQRSWYQDFDRVRWWLYENSGGRRHGGFWLRKYTLNEAGNDQRWFTSLFEGISDFLERLDCLILCYYIWPTYQNWVTRFGLDRRNHRQIQRIPTIHRTRRRKKVQAFDDIDKAKEEVDFTPAEPSGAELASEVETTDILGLGEDPSVGAETSVEASETVASVPEPDVAENLATDPADDLAAPPTSPNLVPPRVEPLQTGHTPASGSRPPRVRSSRGGQTTRWQEAQRSWYQDFDRVRLIILLHPIGQSNLRKAHHQSLLQGSLSPDATQLVLRRVQEPPPDPEDPNDPQGPEEEEGEWVEEEEEEEPQEEDQVLEEEAEPSSIQTHLYLSGC